MVEALPLLVPKSIGQRFQARWQRERFDSLEVRVCVMTALKMVIRDARTQVMNMTKADIARKPLQDLNCPAAQPWCSPIPHSVPSARLQIGVARRRAIRPTPPAKAVTVN
jgi:hypothetical protein